MRAMLSAFTFCLALAVAPLAARAQGWLDKPFDPSSMSRADIATVQAALAFSEDYFYQTNGVWDQYGQDAFEAWALRERGRRTPIFADIDPLVMNLENERVANNWQLYYDKTANVSYLFPFGLLKEVPAESESNQVEFLSADEEFSLILRYEDDAGMAASHQWFLDKTPAGDEPFSYSDENLRLTGVMLDTGFYAFARSDRYAGGWHTISIVVTQRYMPQVNLLAASATPGGSSATLLWTAGGVIDQVINGAVSASAPPAAVPEGPADQVKHPVPAGVPEAPPPASTPPVAADEPIVPGPAPGERPAGPILGTPPAGSSEVASLPTEPEAIPGDDSSDAPEASAPSEVPPKPGGIGVAPGPAPVKAPGIVSDEPGPAEVPGKTETPEEADSPRPKVTGTLKSSGTGFYIAPTTLLTASHVIEGCRAVAMADGTPLEILAADTSLDVAALTGAPDAGAWLKLSALEVPKLGEAVTALGYPYYTSLDQGLTVTSGNVSALRGADGSSNRVMITAPVQPGNSGGPLLNKKGAVIGIVVSRMDDLAVLEETGSLPQNMNFAVPSGPLLTFLAQNRITRPQGEVGSGEMSGEVPDSVANAVVPLHCYE